jgi:hypothetical protein
MTVAVNFRRERLARGWLDLFQHAEAGPWGVAWDPDSGEPDWPGHIYSPHDDDLPSDYPNPAEAEAVAEWGRKHFGP